MQRSVLELKQLLQSKANPVIPILKALKDQGNLTNQDISTALTANIPSKTSRIRPSDALLLREILSYKTMSDATIDSFEILSNSKSFENVYKIWSGYSTQSESKSLLEFAYPIVLDSFASALKMSEFNPFYKSGRKITQLTLHDHWEIVPTISSVWEIYSSSKSAYVPSAALNASLLSAISYVKPVDVFSLKKALKKFPITSTRVRKWNIKEYEAVMRTSSILVSDRSIFDVIYSKFTARKLKWNPNVRDAILQYYVNVPDFKYLRLFCEKALADNNLVISHDLLACVCELAVHDVNYRIESIQKMDTLFDNVGNLLFTGNLNLGPASFELIIQYYVKIKDWSNVQKKFTYFVDVLIPKWKATGAYGFNTKSNSRIALGLTVIDSMFEMYAADLDIASLSNFLNEWLAHPDVQIVYTKNGLMKAEIYRKIELNWKVYGGSIEDLKEIKSQWK